MTDQQLHIRFRIGQLAFTVGILLALAWEYL
jgi:hypothetical protein